MPEPCEVRPLHLVTYENGMAMQETLVRLRQEKKIPDQLLLLEHPPVITLGRGGDVSNLLAPRVGLASAGIRFYETTRGGDITYHGPRQDRRISDRPSRRRATDVRKYVTRLEEVLIRAAAGFGVTATRVEGRRGIWVGDEQAGSDRRSHRSVGDLPWFCLERWH